MCGIAGRTNFKSAAPVSADTLHAMCDLLRHRGPDDGGVWTHGAVGLGHRRLAVIDLSAAGRQPMRSDDGRLTITYNGEIYNFEDVRRDLESRGARFRSRSDTEVILEAYRAFGVGCLSRLNGMFAFAIWDESEQRLFAARDRVGKKPFYYREDADGLAFASEPKAFLAEDAFVPEADPTALFHYLSYQYVPCPQSAFRGVRRLPPAHYLVVERGRVAVERYWSLRYLPKSVRHESDAVEEIGERLREATRARLVSDVPLGAFLSGGLDSSLVVAMMADAGAGRVKTFSIGFDDDAYNELPYARRVAERFGTDHHEAIVQPDAVEILPKLVWHYNEPYADSSAIPTFHLAEMTQRQVTVALNGDGGDESFAGYDRYRASTMAAGLDRLPLVTRRIIARFARAARTEGSGSLRSRALRFLSTVADAPAQRYAKWMFHFDSDRKKAVCTPDFLARVDGADSGAALEALFAGSSGLGLLDSTLHVDVETYLPDDLLVKVDIATMAYGLEGRSPFLDHRLMECAATLPEPFKMSHGQGKRVLRQIARRLLPAEVINRKKVGFGVPLERWFRGELRDLLHDVLLGSRLRNRGYFRMQAVERLVAEHEDGVRGWHYQLWNLLNFELWHETFIDTKPRRARLSPPGRFAQSGEPHGPSL
jgi:asparagine synthase (glutamine-hydrolysing)